MRYFTSKSTLKRLKLQRKAAQKNVLDAATSPALPSWAAPSRRPNTYHWMVDRAYGPCSNEKLPVHGPGDCDVDEAFGPNSERFLMMDDDGEIYYGGLIQGTDYQGFEPLDDFGMPNAGCTEIHYINADGGWDQL